nr:twin-arginine translocation signal domain-containing protein [uncultured Rhodopila sp.]
MIVTNRRKFLTFTAVGAAALALPVRLQAKMPLDQPQAPYF